MTKLSTFCSSLQLTKGASVYSLYVLALLLAAYLLNQLDRYALAIVTKPLAQVPIFFNFDFVASNSTEFYLS